MIYRSICFAVLLVGLAFLCQARADVVIGSEGFENHSVGAPVVTSDYPLDQDESAWLMPDTGTRWVRYVGQAQYSSVVSNATAYSGTNSLSVHRVSGSGTALYCGFGTGAPINVSHQYVLSGLFMNANDQYSWDNAACAFFGATNDPSTNTEYTTQRQLGGWNYYGNKTIGGQGSGSSADYMGVMKAGGSYQAISTTTLPSLVPGDWYKFEMVVTIGANDGTGHYSFTYNTYFTDVTAGGPRVLAYANMSTQKLSSVGIASGWYLFTGCGVPPTGDNYNQVYFDDLAITEIPEPATMSLFGLGILALIRNRKKASIKCDF